MDKETLSPLVWRWSFFIAFAVIIYATISWLFDPTHAVVPTVVIWLIVVSTIRGGREPAMVPQDKVGISEGNVEHGTDGHDLGNFDPNRDWRD